MDMRGYDLRARVAIEEGLLSVWVTQSIGQSWSVNKYCYLSTRDMWEQGHKCYTITSHSSFVTTAKKVSESIVISSYEQNVM